MLKAGDTAPEFALPDEERRIVTLASLLERGAAVVFFYPADFTPVCTREVCMVRDLHTELAAAGLAVAGISADDVDSHRRFRERHGLPFTLLADPAKTAVGAFGVEGPLGFGVRRVTFLIGRDGIVREVVHAGLRVGRHEAFLRRALTAAR
jgi:peroxiredoxin Q/BCP